MIVLYELLFCPIHGLYGVLLAGGYGALHYIVRRLKWIRWTKHKLNANSN